MWDDYRAKAKGVDPFSLKKTSSTISIFNFRRSVLDYYTKLSQVIAYNSAFSMRKKFEELV